MPANVRTYTLNQLAQILGASVQGDPDCEITGLATLEDAEPGQLSFLTNSRYQHLLQKTDASAVIVAESAAAQVSGNALVMANPYLGFARASHLFDATPSVAPGCAVGVSIHPSAQVSAKAQLAENVVVGESSVIEDNVYVGPNTTIGRNCHLAQGVRLNANVTLYDDIKIGRDSLVHSGAVLGADGFGFAPDGGKWVKIAQLGGVSIGADVEIGAGTTIDRGALTDTVISDGVKLDNQIQIAHNVSIGEHSAIAGCTAVAGSTKIGARCTIAGGVGITGHLEIADGSHVTAMSLISRSISEPGAYSSGTGQMPHKDWKRTVVRFRQLDELSKRVKSLEEKIERSKG